MGKEPVEWTSYLIPVAADYNDQRLRSILHIMELCPANASSNWSLGVKFPTCSLSLDFKRLLKPGVADCYKGFFVFSNRFDPIYFQ